MSLTSIAIQNFKSFKDVRVNLGNLNILIGANASGKSNFIQMFTFMRDIIANGLDNAISVQGGPDFITNAHKISDTLSFEFTSDDDGFIPFAGRDKRDDLDILSTTYQCSLAFAIAGQPPQSTESLSEDCLPRRSDTQEHATVTLSGANGRYRLDGRSQDGTSLPMEGTYLGMFVELIERGNRLLLEQSLAKGVFPPAMRIRSLMVYDIDPKEPKKAASIVGKNDLEPDASNLAIVLHRILRDPAQKRKFFNILNDLLPFIDELDTQPFIDRSMFFKIRERYAPELYIPASLMSDGTINLIALIVILYFESAPLVIIEEPERNVHPFLVSKIVSMLRDASKEKQIIISTHNPEIVRHANLDELLLVSRDEQGYSNISRASNMDSVRQFLQDDVGIEELYVQDLLGV
jgi:predicted ATPase